MPGRASPRAPGDGAPGASATTPDPDLASSGRWLHTQGLAAVVYHQVASGLLGEPIGIGPSLVHVEETLARFGARDPAEEMLAAQMVLTHARVLHLTALANGEPTLGAITVLHEAADRASGVYRRQMLALAEYRRPPRPGDTVSIQQNIAAQQVVHAATSKGNTPSELGSTLALPPPLPPDTGRAGLAAFFRRQEPAVDAVHRAANPGGKGPLADERPPAR